MPSQKEKLEEHTPKIILVTGCSSGFGLLFCARLAAKGHTVIATMRNLQKKDALLNEVHRRGGIVDLQALDVTDIHSIHKIIDYIQDHYQRLDVLINNAGYGLAGFFEDLSDSEIRGIMETNFFGVMNVSRQALPLLHQSRKARIINISSVSGFTTYPCFGAYNASKWALEGMSESLMFELKPFGIDVLLVEPGTYRTEIFYANRKYAARFNDPQSRYYGYSQALKELVDDNLAKNKRDPEQVAILVEQLIHSPHPRFRNIPDFPSRILYWTRKCLPFSFFSWLIQNISKIYYKKYG